LTVKLKELRPVNRSVFWPEAVGQFAENQFSKLMDGVNEALDRIEAGLETHAPTGRIELGNLPPESARYFACREQLKKVDRIVQAVERSQQAPKRPAGPDARVPKPKPVKMVVRQMYSKNPMLTRLRDRAGMLVELAEWEAGEPGEMPDSPMLALCRELALLEAMARQPWDDRPALLVIQPLEERDLEFAFGLAQLYFAFLNDIWGSSAAFVFKQFAGLTQEELRLKTLSGEPPPKAQALFLNGYNLRGLVPPGANTVLARRRDGNLGILMTHLHEAASQAEAENVARNYWPEKPAAGPAAFEIAESVLQMMTKNSILDYRNGLVIPAEPQPEEFRALMLSALPLPPEIRF
jgi:hypothetical protein